MQTKVKRFGSWLVAIALIWGGVDIACEYVNAGHYRMPTSAMEPTIKSGDSFRADMSAYESADPQRWDLVIFLSPQDQTRTWVFRVVGLPGETISFGDDGLLIDDQPVALPKTIGVAKYSGSENSGDDEFVVPVDSYYVLGDNPAKANDSRFWGAVSRDAILGKVDLD